MRKALLLLLAAPLAAQTYLTTGDTTLSLAQLLHDHPEGMLLCLPSAQGQSLAEAMRTALGQEPALELQLQMQELSLDQRLGRELQRLKGWSAEKPYWALIGPDRQIYAASSDAPTSAALKAIYTQSPLRTRAEVLRDFLKQNPDHAEAMARLILEVRNLAEQRTEKAVAAQPAPESKEGAPPPALLPAEEDGRIWAEYAELYERFMHEGGWLSGGADPSSPLPLAAQLDTQAEHSPSLRDLAARLLPSVEEHLRDKLSDEGRWKVWLSLRAAGARSRASAVLSGAKALPGALRWPPAAALDAFVEDAEASGDWHEVEPVLQAAFDENEDLLRALHAAAQEDAGLKGSSQPDMGSTFGYGQWNGEVQLLVEAKLRLGKIGEADHVFRQVFARAPRPEFAQAASELAARCGVASLAEQWAALGKP